MRAARAHVWFDTGHGDDARSGDVTLQRAVSALPAVVVWAAAALAGFGASPLSAEQPPPPPPPSFPAAPPTTAAPVQRATTAPPRSTARPAATTTTTPPVTDATTTAPPSTLMTTTTLAPLEPEPLSDPRVATRTEIPGWLVALTAVSLGTNLGLLGAYLGRRYRPAVPARR